ncbi:lactoylglutathione lyase [Protomyces lactucae-debilis]|uniref:Lactoylglutathione lyase n=1 Tax=Protomyces lactucae-debilis TaxID=2754530 RepID=A0A1Y2F998_PROLT|nr:lactoylglutathione lyase [Protomyces lactucae-debilis]ORY80014.1 lactoylglutathione lyase [Protomyces lactucae-debilis]
MSRLLSRVQQTSRHLSRSTSTMTDTATYKFNHTMIRIKDPKVSLPFYQKNFGMKLIDTKDMPDAKFCLYFLAFDSPDAPSQGKDRSDREAVLELTHNYGTEDQDGQVYVSGNQDPHKGFGHICFSVDNLPAACKRLEEDGVKFQKRQSEGRMKQIAFALDPDEYWIELIGHGKEDIEGQFSVQSYRFNHTMIRIKDPKVSLQFYQEALGMHFIAKLEAKEAGFDLYFLSFPKTLPNGVKTADLTPKSESKNQFSDAEGILELTHNHGTESDETTYHNGNEGKDKQGFGHLAISVDNLEACCERFEKLGVQFKKKLTDGRMKSIAFIYDPDKYWIEVIANESLKK